MLLLPFVFLRDFQVLCVFSVPLEKYCVCELDVRKKVFFFLLVDEGSKNDVGMYVEEDDEEDTFNDSYLVGF